MCLSFVESAGAQGVLDLKTVLDRAQSYVASYEERMGTIIGEEDYNQTAMWDGARPGGVLVGSKRRRMSSDFLLTRIDGEWYRVRNVLVVDRKPVTEKHDLASVMSPGHFGAR